MARYSKSAGRDVKRAMRRRKKGSLKSGKGGKGGTVKSRKQAIAIGQVQQEEVSQEEVFPAPDVQAQVAPVGLPRGGLGATSQPSLAGQR